MSSIAASDVGYDIVLFAYAGKRMIGTIYNSNNNSQDVEYIPSSVTDRTSVIGTLVGLEKVKSDYIVISNPCEIEFSIDKPVTGSATLNWDLKPFFFKLLHTSDSSKKNQFIFPKNQVVLSNICMQMIDNNLIKAYQQICQADV